jgi:hypothetical protein
MSAKLQLSVNVIQAGDVMVSQRDVDSHLKNPLAASK